MTNYFNIAMTVLFAQNLFLVLLLTTGVNTQIFIRPKHSLAMGICLTLVLVILTPLSRLAEALLRLVGQEHLLLLVFTLLAFGGTAGLGWCLRHLSPGLWQWVRPGAEDLSLNAGILGVFLLAWQESYNPLEAVVFGFFGGVGLLVALLSLVGISQNLTGKGCPQPIRGLPLLLITAGFLSLSLMGFCGLHLG